MSISSRRSSACSSSDQSCASGLSCIWQASRLLRIARQFGAARSSRCSAIPATPIRGVAAQAQRICCSYPCTTFLQAHGLDSCRGRRTNIWPRGARFSVPCPIGDARDILVEAGEHVLCRPADVGAMHANPHRCVDRSSRVCPLLRSRLGPTWQTDTSTAASPANSRGSSMRYSRGRESLNAPDSLRSRRPYRGPRRRIVAQALPRTKNGRRWCTAKSDRVAIPTRPWWKASRATRQCAVAACPTRSRRAGSPRAWCGRCRRT